MTIADEEKSPQPARRAIWHRLACQVALGAAGAAGSALFSWLMWWLRGG